MTHRPDFPYWTKEFHKECGLLFDRIDRNREADNAIQNYFIDYPKNDEISVVLTKVTLVNSLYSTKIYDPYNIARKITDKHELIDFKLNSGNFDAVEIIKTITELNRYSFATKYCSFHNPQKFPIFDNDVATLLYEMKTHYPSWHLPNIVSRENLKEYNLFQTIIDQCIAEFQLPPTQLGNYKKIDKGLWICAKYLKAYDLQIKVKHLTGPQKVLLEEVVQIVQKLYPDKIPIELFRGE